jgi:hypothetical protein
MEILLQMRQRYDSCHLYALNSCQWNWNGRKIKTCIQNIEIDRGNNISKAYLHLERSLDDDWKDYDINWYPDDIIIAENKLYGLTNDEICLKLRDCILQTLKERYPGIKLIDIFGY